MAANTSESGVWGYATVKPQCHVTESSRTLKKLCHRGFQTCAHGKKKKKPRNLVSLTLEKLELIMRLLPLDSLGKGMPHELKVSAVD